MRSGSMEPFFGLGHLRNQFWPGLRFRVKRFSYVRLFLTLGILLSFGLPSNFGVCDLTKGLSESFPALVIEGSQL